MLKVACEQWRWLWVVGSSGGGCGLWVCSSESSNESGRDKCKRYNK